MQKGGEAVAINHVTVDTASRLLGVTPQAIRKKIVEKKIATSRVKGCSGGGASGVSYLIPTSELPMEAQILLALQQENVGEADLTAYRERFGEEGLERVLAIRDAVLELRTIEDKEAAWNRREEIGRALGVQARRVQEWEQQYRKEGVKGIMARMERSDKGKSRALCTLAQEMLLHLYAAPGKISQNRARRHLLDLQKKHGADICEGCPHNPGSMYRAEMISRGKDPGELCRKAGEGLIVSPSKDAVNRLIARMDKGLITLGRLGEKRFDDLYRPTVRRDKPTRINEGWYGDHHQFDVFVRDSRGRAQRPWLTAWMDAASNTMVGWQLSFAPNRHTIMESLALAIARTKGSDIYGLPLLIYIDNGMDYRSKAMQGAGNTEIELGKLNLDMVPENGLLKTLGIGVKYAIVENARAKPIERLFGVIESQWIKGLPGYCGNSTEIKPEDYMGQIKRGEIMDFEEFVAYFTSVIVPGYDNWKGAEDKAESPREIRARMPKARPETVSWAMLSMAMSERVERSVRPDGIYISNVRYWDSCLANLIGERVTVRTFQDNRDVVSVFHGLTYVGTIGKAENFKMLDEDPEKIADFRAVAMGARKSRVQQLRVAKDRVRVVLDRAMEIPDLSNPAMITGIIQERMAQDKKELEQRTEQRQQAARKKDDPFLRRRIAEGAALLEQIG